eukprot:Clim_evm2s23 gene=Clim_evmTU2s23
MATLLRHVTVLDSSGLRAPGERVPADDSFWLEFECLRQTPLNLRIVLKLDVANRESDIDPVVLVNGRVIENGKGKFCIDTSAYSHVPEISLANVHALEIEIMDETTSEKHQCQLIMQNEYQKTGQQGILQLFRTVFVPLDMSKESKRESD